jgi:FkbM family methyltransferase
MGSLESPHSKIGGQAGEVRVPVARLSDVLTDLARLDFVKCDVEGHERAVLAGALPLLERFHRSS